MGTLFYIHVYDKDGVVVGMVECKDEESAHRQFITLCCSSDKVADFVKVFLTGDPVPLVWAYRGCKSMRMLIADTSVRNAIN